jgi:hypothetical protein
MLSASPRSHIYFDKEERKNEKKEKRKPWELAGREGLSRFFTKNTTRQWRVEIFCKNPKGLTLKSRNGRPIFAAFFYF